MECASLILAVSVFEAVGNPWCLLSSKGHVQIRGCVEINCQKKSCGHPHWPACKGWSLAGSGLTPKPFRGKDSSKQQLVLHYFFWTEGVERRKRNKEKEVLEKSFRERYIVPKFYCRLTSLRCQLTPSPYWLQPSSRGGKV